MSEPTPGPIGDGTRPAPDREQVLGLLAYFPFLCFIPLLMEEASDALHRHARQGLVLTIAEVILYILYTAPEFISTVLELGLVVCVVLAVIGAVNAWQGKYWPIPYISDLAERKWSKSSPEDEPR